MRTKIIFKKLFSILFSILSITMLVTLFFIVIQPIGLPVSTGSYYNIEAKLQLKHLYQLQSRYHKLHNTYTKESSDCRYEVPLTLLEGGHARYTYEISYADSNYFIAHAIAIEDFDGDGVINLYQVGVEGNVIEVFPD